MGGLFRVLVLLGFLATYWWIILLVSAAIIIGLLAWLAHQRQLEATGRRRREQAALVARADQQHAWVLGGDEAKVCNALQTFSSVGIYGQYPPSMSSNAR